jgi:APA family basic amino acid/polyamine antiporter
VPRPEPQYLRRELRLSQAVALGIGGTVGGGIYVLTGAVADRAGPAALVAFGVAFACSLLIALPYAELSCRYPLAGGGYAFARQVLGPSAGFLMGWCYWGAYVFISGYVTLGFGGYLHSLAGVPVLGGVFALLAGAVVLNLSGIRASGRTQALVIAVAVLALVGFSSWGAGYVRGSHFTPFAPNGAEGVLVASLLAFLAFGGFDIVAAAGEEIVDPERNLPRAILTTLAAVLAIYVAVTAVGIGVLGASTLGDEQAPLAVAAEAFGGEPARAVVTLSALLTTAATANAILVVTSRVAFAMARDGLMPAWLGTISATTGAPARALLLNGGLFAAVALIGSVSVYTAIGGWLYVLHFVVPLVVLCVLRSRGSSTPGFRTPLARLVIPAAFLACAVLLVASGPTGMIGGALWVLLGSFVYLHAGTDPRVS